MAIGFQNYSNIDTTDPTNYPDGAIRDDDGSGNGTPVNRQVYNDMHQIWAKLLRLAGITPSGVAENETGGFQYLTALVAYIRSVTATTVLSGTSRIATSGEANAGTNTNAYITPATLKSSHKVMGVDVAGVKLVTKVIDIGDWNMDTVASVSVAHGVTDSKIRSATAMIRNDGNNTFVLISFVDATTCVPQGGIGGYNATNITLVRLTGGAFDSASFAATSYTRGTVTIIYEE